MVPLTRGVPFTAALLQRLHQADFCPMVFPDQHAWRIGEVIHVHSPDIRVYVRKKVTYDFSAVGIQARDKICYYRLRQRWELPCSGKESRKPFHDRVHHRFWHSERRSRHLQSRHFGCRPRRTHHGHHTSSDPVLD